MSPVCGASSGACPARGGEESCRERSLTVGVVSSCPCDRHVEQVLTRGVLIATLPHYRSRSCTGGHSQNRVRLPSGTDPQSYHGMTHACGSDVAYSRLWFRRPSSPYHAVRIRFGVTQQRTHLRGSAVTPHLPSDRHTQHSLCIGMPSTRLWIAGVMSESCCNSSRHCSTASESLPPTLGH